MTKGLRKHLHLHQRPTPKPRPSPNSTNPMRRQTAVTWQGLERGLAPGHYTTTTSLPLRAGVLLQRSLLGEGPTRQPPQLHLNRVLAAFHHNRVPRLMDHRDTKAGCPLSFHTWRGERRVAAQHPSPGDTGNL